MPGWDNTARNQNKGFCLADATPGSFQAWLETVIVETKRDLQGNERLVFINAWNEWAEGAYLEPDKRFGHAFLEAVRNARDAAFLLRAAGTGDMQ
jgi:lipopolysaccharide biosynthesis protein